MLTDAEISKSNKFEQMQITFLTLQLGAKKKQSFTIKIEIISFLTKIFFI